MLPIEAIHSLRASEPRGFSQLHSIMLMLPQCGTFLPCFSLCSSRFSPINITMTRYNNPTTIKVTWRPFTLVEARGFIEYVVQLHMSSSIKRQNRLLVQRVPMNQSTVVFAGLDADSDYEVSVGTVSLDGDTMGPGEQSRCNFKTKQSNCPCLAIVTGFKRRGPLHNHAKMLKAIMSP